MGKKSYLVLIVGIVLMLFVGCSHAEQEYVVQAPSSPAIQDSGTEISSIKVGNIETNDGKNLKISMDGGTKNNFGELSFSKGETFKIFVVSENDVELEIGIVSINTEEVFSDIVKSREDEVIITVPEDGKYRIYISNKDEQSATFDIKLSKVIEGPIV